MGDRWQVKVGDAEIKDPWQVDFGPIQDYREIPDPYDFELGPIQDYREYDGSDVEIGPAEVDPLVFGQAEIMDPWQVDFGPAQDVVEMGPAEVTGDGDFEVGNPDQEGPPYSVMVKKGRTSAYGR